MATLGRRNSDPIKGTTTDTTTKLQWTGPLGGRGLETINEEGSDCSQGTTQPSPSKPTYILKAI